jgi:tetratricopeptide (TPR) repeat protein
MYQIKRSLLTILAVSVLLSRWYGPAVAQNQEARILELGKTVERELAEQAHNYLIELAANDFLHVIVDQRGVDVVVTLYAPDGKRLKEVDSPNGDVGPEPVLLIAETAGVYRLEVRSLEKGAAGKYTASIIENRKATTEDRAQIAKQALTEQARDLSDQAISLYDQGRYNEGVLLAERALGIRERVLGPDHLDVAESLNNLAALYRRSTDFARAEALYQRSLAIREKALGPEHPDVALVLNNLASLYQDRGNYAPAAPLFQRALTIFEKALGPEHPDVATLLNNLAGLYRDTGDYARGEPLFKRALAIFEKALGPEHPDVALTLDNLANLYLDTREYARAKPLSQRALAIREKALGQDHPDVAGSLNNLANLYQVTGDFSLAEPPVPRPFINARWLYGRKPWGWSIPRWQVRLTLWLTCTKPLATMG